MPVWQSAPARQLAPIAPFSHVRDVVLHASLRQCSLAVQVSPNPLNWHVPAQLSVTQSVLAVHESPGLPT